MPTQTVAQACSALKLPLDATYTQIKASFHRLSLKYHPDKASDSDEAHEKYVEILAAWELLRDKRPRHEAASHRKPGHPAKPANTSSKTHGSKRASNQARTPTDDGQTRSKERRYHKDLRKRSSKLGNRLFHVGLKTHKQWNVWKRLHSQRPAKATFGVSGFFESIASCIPHKQKALQAAEIQLRFGREDALRRHMGGLGIYVSRAEAVLEDLAAIAEQWQVARSARMQRRQESRFAVKLGFFPGVKSDAERRKNFVDLTL